MHIGLTLPQGAVQYVVYDRMTWAQIFSLMERAKRSLNLQDYSVYQTSLEQVRCVAVCVECTLSTRRSSSSLRAISSRSSRKHFLAMLCFSVASHFPTAS